MTREQQVFARLKKDKEYRDLFVESEIDVGIPLQIRGMREHRGWTQKDLAEKCGKRQSVISQLEDTGYGRLTLTTLKTLASAFDVGLMVRFVPFSELVRKATNLSNTDIAVPEFSEDTGFAPVTTDTANWMATDPEGFGVTILIKTDDYQTIFKGQDIYGGTEDNQATPSHTAWHRDYSDLLF